VRPTRSNDNGGKKNFEEFEAKKIYKSPEYHGLYSSSGYAKLEEAIRDMLDAYPGYERLIGYILRREADEVHDGSGDKYKDDVPQGPHRCQGI
jgi:hypothetical protein